MDSKHAKRLMLDVIGIVLAWNERLLSDKQAMDKIVGSLLEDQSKKNGLNRKKTTKKSAGLLATAAGLGIILFVVVVSTDVFPNDDNNLVSENEEIGFEQLGEIPSEGTEKILNNEEELSNKQISEEG